MFGSEVFGSEKGSDNSIEKKTAQCGTEKLRWKYLMRLTAAIFFLGSHRSRYTGLEKMLDSLRKPAQDSRGRLLSLLPLLLKFSSEVE